SPEQGASEAAPPVRFGMYMSLQEYAQEKLRQLGDGIEQDIAIRHGAWYAAYGSDPAVDALEGHGGVVRRRELELELENLLAAARRAIARGDGRTAAETFNAAYAVL